jgi:raffinose/stachyose/melibiose transport system substrate-binding protein
MWVVAGHGLLSAPFNVAGGFMTHPRGVGRLARRAGSVALAAVTAVALAGCSAPGSSGSESSASAAPGSVSTSIGTAPITLKLYDGQGLKKVDDALIAAFTAKFPNVTITPTYDPDDVTTQNQPRLLASETPPDLARVISVTAGVKDGLLSNLDAYATAYGWDKLPESQLSQYRAANNVAGSGSLYAKPTGFTMTGLYYNKQLATQVGMTTPPASVADLTAMFEKAKAAGLSGLVVGNKEGAATMPIGIMMASSLGVKKTSEWVFNAPNATIDAPESVAVAKQVQDWNNAGYFPDGVNGLDATAATGLFTSGKGVFYTWGNWEAANLDKTMPGNVGFMPFPAVAAGGQLAAMSDAATAFGIPAKSTNKDAAAAFLNFLSSDEARQIDIDNGFMPTGTTDQKAPTVRDGSVLADVQAAFATVSDAGGLVPFVQNATAGISNQAWNPESQLLLGGQDTPEQFVKNIQAKYTEELQQ